MEFQGKRGDQVNFLLGEIEKLKSEHQITGASVVAHWTIQRVQPLQQGVHLAFEYTGEGDPTRYTLEKISEDDLEDRVFLQPSGLAGVLGRYNFE